MGPSEPIQCERTPMPKEDEAPAAPRACATGDCPFQATWHPTHCCAACKGDGTCHHGPMCERKRMHEKDEEGERAGEEVAAKQKAEEEEVTQKVTHFAFPVVVEDGRELTIEWDSNEDPFEAAQIFAVSHGIVPEELQKIVAFIEHANATHSITM